MKQQQSVKQSSGRVRERERKKKLGAKEPFSAAISYLELEDPVRSFEWVEDRLLHDGVRPVRPEEVVAAEAVIDDESRCCWIDAEAATAAAAAELLPPPLRGSRSTSSKKWAWHSREAKSTWSFRPASARPLSS